MFQQGRDIISGPDGSLTFTPIPEGEDRPPFIRVVDPSLDKIQDKYTPSRAERKENLSNVKAPCDAQCGKILPRNELKICSRCKQARYCSQACQKTDWRAGHKADCGQGPPRDLALKLAERGLAVPKIVEHFWMMSILMLELLKHRSNATKYAMRVQCEMTVADYYAAIQRMMSQQPADENAQTVLKYSKAMRVPLEDAPENTQRVAKEAREKYANDRRDADGQFSPDDNPILVVYFVTEEDQTGRNGALSAAYVIPSWALAYMASNPKQTFRSSLTGDREVDTSMDSLFDSLNALIRMDKQNKLRLRGYPQPKPADSPPESTQSKSTDERAMQDVDGLLSRLGVTEEDLDAKPAGGVAAATD